MTIIVFVINATSHSIAFHITTRYSLQHQCSVMLKLHGLDSQSDKYECLHAVHHNLGQTEIKKQKIHVMKDNVFGVANNM